MENIAQCSPVGEAKRQAGRGGVPKQSRVDGVTRPPNISLYSESGFINHMLIKPLVTTA